MKHLKHFIVLVYQSSDCKKKLKGNKPIDKKILIGVNMALNLRIPEEEQQCRLNYGRSKKSRDTLEGPALG